MFLLVPYSVLLSLIAGLAWVIRDSPQNDEKLVFGVMWGFFSIGISGWLVLNGLSEIFAGIVVIGASAVGFFASELKRFVFPEAPVK